MKNKPNPGLVQQVKLPGINTWMLLLLTPPTSPSINFPLAAWVLQDTQHPNAACFTPFSFSRTATPGRGQSKAGFSCRYVDLNPIYEYRAHRFEQEIVRAAFLQPGSMKLLQAAFPWLWWCLRKDYSRTCNELTLPWRSEPMA